MKLPLRAFGDDRTCFACAIRSVGDCFRFVLLGTIAYACASCFWGQDSIFMVFGQIWRVDWLLVFKWGIVDEVWLRTTEVVVPTGLLYK